MFNIDLAKKLGKQYQSAFPYPYIIIDNFFDESLLEKSIQELNNYQNWGSDTSQDIFEVNKYFTPWCKENIQDLKKEAPITSYNIDVLNSEPTLRFLEELTGIQDLLVDIGGFGSSVHKILNGGQLAVHADYSYHRETNLHRRINLLLYLNKDWKKEYNGNLELWTPDMKNLVADIEPIFNRAVIFNTTLDSLHGHPKPLNTPPSVCRMSYAMYYFTKERPQEEIDKNKREGDLTSVFWKESPQETVQRKNSLDGLFKF
jgi:Rps23 Pro-64 3,4-dihydroxylase Tpa1-like proline 4-hydroxylase